MTHGDYGSFLSEVRRLVSVFRVRLQPSELEQLASAYFGALKRFTTEQVIAGADRWIEKESRFPKPAEWASCVPARIVELPVLSESDAADWLRAEKLKWEDEPCQCVSCQRAEVHEKPIRFVPEVDELGLDVHVLIGSRIVTKGHWAHGAELARWYTARADFWNAYYTLVGPQRAKKVQRIPLKDRMEAIFKKRDVPVTVGE